MRRLTNDLIEISLIPEVGGKIISLKNRCSGHEWIWHPQAAPEFRRPEPDADFASTNLGGIDECLPTVKAQSHGGFHFSDHGQVWRLPASVKEVTDDRITLETVLTEAPLRFIRTVALEGPTVHFQYALENLSDQPVPFIWAFHPLLRIEAGDRIEIRPDPIPTRVDCVANLPGCLENEPFAWPRISGEIDLTKPPVEGDPAFCTKLFFKSRIQNTATLVSAAYSEKLTLNWSGEDCPYFGLWLTCGAWNGHTHLAFEPTNHPSDLFMAPSPPLLNPRATTHWQITMSL